MLTDSLINLAGTTAIMGAFADSLAIAKEPLAISQSLNNKWAQSYSLFPAIVVNRRYFDVQVTLSLMDRGILLAEEVGFTGMQTIMGAHKATVINGRWRAYPSEASGSTSKANRRQQYPLFSPCLSARR